MKTVDALALGMLLLQGCRGDTGTGPPRVAQVVVRQQIARLLFVVQPSDALAGEAITPAIAAELQDPGGHRVTDAAVPVTLTLSANPGGATLGGTRTVTSSGGVATFNDVWL